MTTNRPRLPVVVLISGNGSNLQAMIDGMDTNSLPIDIRAVVSNRPEAYGLQRAKNAHIPTEIVDHTCFPDRSDFDAALLECIDQYQPELVVLAGFMRILNPVIVQRYAGRMLNIHPSLLPEFTGLNTHQRVLDAGRNEHGVSVHFVTANLDGGPVIAYSRIPVTPNDDADSLSRKIHSKEHRLYPTVIGWYAKGRLKMLHQQVYLDNHPLATPEEIV